MANIFNNFKSTNSKEIAPMLIAHTINFALGNPVVSKEQVSKQQLRVYLNVANNYMKAIVRVKKI